MDERNTMSDELQRITLAYVEGCERGSGPTLEALVEMYPQYANELIDFAMNYYIAEELGDDDPVQSSVPQKDRDLEHRVLEDAFTQIQYPPALTSLIARARERGYERATYVDGSMQDCPGARYVVEGRLCQLGRDGVLRVVANEERRAA